MMALYHQLHLMENTSTNSSLYYVYDNLTYTFKHYKDKKAFDDQLEYDLLLTEKILSGLTNFSLIILGVLITPILSNAATDTKTQRVQKYSRPSAGTTVIDLDSSGAVISSSVKNLKSGEKPKIGGRFRKLNEDSLLGDIMFLSYRLGYSFLFNSEKPEIMARTPLQGFLQKTTSPLVFRYSNAPFTPVISQSLSANSISVFPVLFFSLSASLVIFNTLFVNRKIIQKWFVNYFRKQKNILEIQPLEHDSQSAELQLNNKKIIISRFLFILGISVLVLFFVLLIVQNFESRKQKMLYLVNTKQNLTRINECLELAGSLLKDNQTFHFFLKRANSLGKKVKNFEPYIAENEQKKFQNLVREFALLFEQYGDGDGG